MNKVKEKQLRENEEKEGGESFPTKILKSFQIQIPRNVVEYLKLKVGDRVRVTVKKI